MKWKGSVVVRICVYLQWGGTETELLSFWRHFLTTGCTISCQNDNYLCSQWCISVSVIYGGTQHIPTNIHTQIAFLCFVGWLYRPKCFTMLHKNNDINHSEAKHNKTVCIFHGIKCQWFHISWDIVWMVSYFMGYNGVNGSQAGCEVAQLSWLSGCVSWRAGELGSAHVLMGRWLMAYHCWAEGKLTIHLSHGWISARKT